jgi:hypothetical protein
LITIFHVFLKTQIQERLEAKEEKEKQARLEKTPKSQEKAETARLERLRKSQEKPGKMEGGGKSLEGVEQGLTKRVRDIQQGCWREAAMEACRRVLQQDSFSEKEFKLERNAHATRNHAVESQRVAQEQTEPKKLLSLSKKGGSKTGGDKQMAGIGEQSSLAMEGASNEMQIEGGGKSLEGVGQGHTKRVRDIEQGCLRESAMEACRRVLQTR